MVKAPHRVVVYAVAGLSIISVLAYAALMIFVGPESPPETLANIAMTGIGVLGGMAMPQQG
jgi:predicted Kef-type K+ transport protein